MRAYAIALMMAAGLALASIASVDLVRARSGSNSKAIGKVVTANGSVTIEHTGAVVVQAATGGNGHAKVGDFVYQGDVVQTGAESSIGIVFLDGSAFNLASNARITLNEFVYAPDRRQAGSALVRFRRAWRCARRGGSSIPRRKRANRDC